MSSLTRAAALSLIERNIAVHGHHIYVVSGGASPRYAYTIGVSDVLGAELVLAGGAIFTADEVKRIINDAVERLRGGGSFETSVTIESLGSFSFRKADPSWVRALCLGALDHYRDRDVSAYQLVPDREHWTIDVPDLARARSAASEPIWQWLTAPWPHAAPPRSAAVTNLDALRGRRVTEAARWEEDQWEVFAGPGPDVPREDMRVVPLATLLGADASLGAVVNLVIGEALWRDDEDGDWQPWASRS